MDYGKDLPVKIGQKAQDSLTKFEGIVVGIQFYLNGCTYYQLQPETVKADGSPADVVSLEASRLECLFDGTSYTFGTGGGMESPAELGLPYTDSITGFQGVAESILFYYDNSTRVGLRWQGLHEGKPIPLEWYDQDQLREVKMAKFKEAQAVKTPGGPNLPSASRPTGVSR